MPFMTQNFMGLLSYIYKHEVEHGPEVFSYYVGEVENYEPIKENWISQPKLNFGGSLINFLSRCYYNQIILAFTWYVQVCELLYLQAILFEIDCAFFTQIYMNCSVSWWVEQTG